MIERRKINRSIKALSRRRDWLLERVVMSKRDLSFDKSERLALQIAITVLEALMQGQKVEVSGGFSNRSRYIEQRENQATPAEPERHEVPTGTPHS